MVIILGPTATGKTSLSVKLAYDFDGEIISADSRQIYKGMDIGTGKDLDDYIIHNQQINYHRRRLKPWTISWGGKIGNDGNKKLCKQGCIQENANKKRNKC